MFDTAIVIGVTLATTLFLLMLSGQLHDTTAGNLIARSPAPLAAPISTGPSPESSASARPTPSPRFATSSASPSPATTPDESEGDANVTDDSTIQSAIDRKLQDNAELSSLNIVATVSAGKVVVVGTVASDELKEKIARLIRTIKGVKQVDNKIAVVHEN